MANLFVTWRIFTKGIRKQEAEQSVRVFDMLAVMA